MSRVKIEPAEEVRLELTRPVRTTLFESVRLPFPALLLLVHPDGIEPSSKAPQALILSIELRVQTHYRS